MIASIESTSRVRGRKNAIRNALLMSIALVPAMTVAMAAPKVLSLIKDEHLDLFVPRDPKQRLRENISRLKKKGLIEFQESGGSKYIRLTIAGERELRRVTHQETSIVIPRRWDRKWRLVIFDIPEKKKGQRDRVRALVQKLGFYRLQNSVWAFPYDCEEIIALLKTDLRIGKEMLYIIADAIEFDRPLRTHFRLPLSD